MRTQEVSEHPLLVEAGAWYPISLPRKRREFWDHPESTHYLCSRGGSCFRAVFRAQIRDRKLDGILCPKDGPPCSLSEGSCVHLPLPTILCVCLQAAVSSFDPEATISTVFFPSFCGRTGQCRRPTTPLAGPDHLTPFLTPQSLPVSTRPGPSLFRTTTTTGKTTALAGTRLRRTGSTYPDVSKQTHMGSNDDRGQQPTPDCPFWFSRLQTARAWHRRPSRSECLPAAHPASIAAEGPSGREGRENAQHCTGRLARVHMGGRQGTGGATLPLTATDGPSGPARVETAQAGLGSFGSLQTAPGGTRRPQTAPDGSRRLQTPPDGQNGPRRHQTAPGGPRRLQTPPDGPERPQTAPDGQTRLRRAPGEPRRTQAAHDASRRTQPAPDGQRRRRPTQNGPRWTQMDPDGSRWQQTAPCGPPWVCAGPTRPQTDPDGSSRNQTAPPGPLWRSS